MVHRAPTVPALGAVLLQGNLDATDLPGRAMGTAGAALVGVGREELEARVAVGRVPIAEIVLVEAAMVPALAAPGTIAGKAGTIGANNGIMDVRTAEAEATGLTGMTVDRPTVGAGGIGGTAEADGIEDGTTVTASTEAVSTITLSSPAVFITPGISILPSGIVITQPTGSGPPGDSMGILRPGSSSLMGMLPTVIIAQDQTTLTEMMAGEAGAKLH